MLGLFQASLLYILVQCKQRPLRATTLKVLTHIESTAAALALGKMQSQPFCSTLDSPRNIPTCNNCQLSSSRRGWPCKGYPLPPWIWVQSSAECYNVAHESRVPRWASWRGGTCAKLCTGVNPWHGCGCSQTRVSLFHRLSYCIFYRAAWSEQCCRFRCMWNNTLHGNRQGPPVCRLALQGVCHAWSKRPFSGSVCVSVC